MHAGVVMSQTCGFMHSREKEGRAYGGSWMPFARGTNGRASGDIETAQSSMESAVLCSLTSASAGSSWTSSPATPSRRSRSPHMPRHSWERWKTRSCSLFRSRDDRDDPPRPPPRLDLRFEDPPVWMPCFSRFQSLPPCRRPPPSACSPSLSSSDISPAGPGTRRLCAVEGGGFMVGRRARALCV